MEALGLKKKKDFFFFFFFVSSKREETSKGFAKKLFLKTLTANTGCVCVHTSHKLLQHRWFLAYKLPCLRGSAHFGKPSCLWVFKNYIQQNVVSPVAGTSGGSCCLAGAQLVQPTLGPAVGLINSLSSPPLSLPLQGTLNKWDHAFQALQLRFAQESWILDH